MDNKWPSKEEDIYVRAYVRGRNDYREGIEINPYSANSLEGINWEAGQEDAYAEEMEEESND